MTTLVLVWQIILDCRQDSKSYASNDGIFRFDLVFLHGCYSTKPLRGSEKTFLEKTNGITEPTLLPPIDKAPDFHKSKLECLLTDSSIHFIVYDILLCFIVLALVVFLPCFVSISNMAVSRNLSDVCDVGYYTIGIFRLESQEIDTLPFEEFQIEISS